MSQFLRAQFALLRQPIFISVLVTLVLLSPLLAIAIGTAKIGVLDVLDTYLCHLMAACSEPDLTQRIVWELRTPRVILAFLTGAGLALAGALLQTVTRNPLADPYLFGVSNGASFGAVVVISTLGATVGVGMVMGAFIGSAISVTIVMALAGRGVQIERMLLAGVAVAYMFSAATSLVLYSSDPEVTVNYLFWALGSLARAEWNQLPLPFLVVGLGLLVTLAFHRQLRAVLSGEESAQTLGVNVSRLRLGMLFLASLMTATLVAYTGGIGFIGLMIPHVVRRVMGVNNAKTLMATAMLGGLFLVWVDVVARTLMENQEMPVGIITAGIGSLFFLAVLYRRRWIDG